MSLQQNERDKRFPLVKAEKDRIDQRAKAFSRNLLGVASVPVEKPTLHGLMTMASELQSRHDALSKRHGVSQKELKTLVTLVRARLAGRVQDLPS